MMDDLISLADDGTVADVFLLDQWVCRNVELLGWVAGVEQKESMMTVIRS
jgi:hypothetical protein